MEKNNADEKYLIMGDFNIDWLENNISKTRLEEIIGDNYLRQIVTQPTRISSTRSSLIDYVLTNIENTIVTTNLNMKISDHESLEINIPIKEKIKDLKSKKIKTLMYDNNIFRNNLIYERINHIYNNYDYHEMANEFVACINNALAPMISTKIVKTPSTNLWFSNSLKRMKEVKKQMYQKAVWFNNVYHWNNYRAFRNQYKAEISIAKNNYINNKISSCTDQKAMWKTIKSLILKKENTKIQEIKIAGKVLSNEQEISNELNSFFITSVEQIVNSIPYIKYENIIEENPNTMFKFESVDSRILIDTMKAMNNKKDQNFLTVKTLLNNYDMLGSQLQRLIELSLQTGNFPDCLKESCIVPIQKVKNTTDPQEIRPVNMLTTISKVLEKIVHSQLNKYFENNKLLSETQSGFRSQHSCESLLNLVISQWKTEVYNKRFVVAVFLDLKRAFETVNREILLDKLNKYGIKGIELKWFDSYLSNRTQRTKCGECMSTIKNVNTGVPQGAVLGSLLFLIYINDLGKVLKRAKVCMFADDALIYISGTNVEECIRILNCELRDVEAYLKMNKMKLNTKKTKAMVINGSTDENILIDGETIEKVEEIKYLGVIFDKKLKFDLHFNYICKKNSKK